MYKVFSRTQCMSHLTRLFDAAVHATKEVDRSCSVTPNACFAYGNVEGGLTIALLGTVEIGIGRSMKKDSYTNFKDLMAGEKLDKDYTIESRRMANSLVAIVAPHGGTIEPMTDEIADRIAGNEFSFYAFRALKRNSGLHVKSTLFDEPSCLDMLATHERALSIHGWDASEARVCIGGRDKQLMLALKNDLGKAGITVEDAAGQLRGSDPRNIVNRCKTGAGVQFELTMEFRENARLADSFVQVIRSALSHLKNDS